MQDVLENLSLFMKEIINTEALTEFIFGKIESLAPLSIKLSNNKILPKEFLDFVPKTMFLKDTTNELELNNNILLCKLKGGQKFIIVDILDNTINNSISTVASITPLTFTLENGKTLAKMEFMAFSKSLENLKSSTNIEDIGKQIITTRLNDGKYLFLDELGG